MRLRYLLPLQPPAEFDLHMPLQQPYAGEDAHHAAGCYGLYTVLVGGRLGGGMVCGGGQRWDIASFRGVWVGGGLGSSGGILHQGGLGGSFVLCAGDWGCRRGEMDGGWVLRG